MPLLNDNDIDRLSREAADQYDVDQRPSGWESLQHRLDEELPQKRRRGLLLWWLLAGLLLTSGALLLINRKQKNSLTEIAETKQTFSEGISTKSQNIQEKIADEIKTSDSERNHTNAFQHPTLNGGTVNQKANQITVTTNQGVNVNKQSFISNPNRVANHLNNLKPNSGKPARNSSENLPDIWHQPVKNNQAASSSNIESVPSVSGTSKPEVNQQINTLNNSTIQPAPLNNQQATAQTTDSSTTIDTAVLTKAKKKSADPSSRKHNWYAALIAGPDFSNVRFSTAGRTGLNAGVQIGFYLSDRLSLNTGIVYNKKNYKARAKDFTPKGAMRYVDIEKIIGNCTMFDIPLNIRYDVAVKQSSRYFLSAGISSYLMDKEDYDYYYYYNGVYGERNWNTDSNSNYLFSVINLSGGWETTISNKLRLQIEPYLKIPVKGVGNGNIQLNSFGINLGLQYRFGKNAGNQK